jgi:hypothetical protein
MKLSLEELCAMMHAKGYRYASLSAGPPVMGHMHPGPKPSPAWYFSRLDTGYGADSFAVEEGECSLSWADWCRGQDFHEAEYAALPIIFAKFDLSKLVSDHKDLSRWTVSDTHSFVPHYNWDQMCADGFHGVYADRPRHAKWVQGWNVPTIAVWKPEGCVYDVKMFQNAGAWEYNVQMEDVGSPPGAFLSIIKSLHTRITALEQKR